MRSAALALSGKGMTRRVPLRRRHKTLEEFAVLAAKARARSAKKRRDREGNDLNHLALVRQIQCSLCEITKGVQPHHLQSGPARALRGVGMKAPDRYSVPLCAFPFGSHHEDLHALGSRHEEEFFAAYGINPFHLAEALWVNSRSGGNAVTMNRIVLAHKLAGSKVLLSRRNQARG